MCFIPFYFRWDSKACGSLIFFVYFFCIFFYFSFNQQSLRWTICSLLVFVFHWDTRACGERFFSFRWDKILCGNHIFAISFIFCFSYPWDTRSGGNQLLKSRLPGAVQTALALLAFLFISRGGGERGGLAEQGGEAKSLFLFFPSVFILFSSYLQSLLFSSL